VVNFGRLHLRGFIGWLFWSVVPLLVSGLEIERNPIRK
jgi:hypothetical protein